VTKDPAFTGVYHVSFPQNVSGCAAVVSQGEASNNGFLPGTLYMAVVQSDPNNTGNAHQINVYPTTGSAATRCGPRRGGVRPGRTGAAGWAACRAGDTGSNR
jgi:hypothetical protein